MNVIAEIQRINQEELDQNIPFSGSWHQKYKHSAWIYVGGLAYELSEGDVLCVFSQLGEIEDLHLVRDEETGKSKGFAFIKYENQLSTVLAVDNFNNSQLLNRTLRVDHVDKYKLPKHVRDREEEEEEGDELSLRGQSGHAYEGKELANKFNLEKGTDVFAPIKLSKKERKLAKKAKKKAKKRSKAKAKPMLQLTTKPQGPMLPPKPVKPIRPSQPSVPSSSGWRGRCEPQQ